MRSWEVKAMGNGYGLIAGVDEAGRGALAGPVVAAAVILPRGYHHQAIRDSKTIREQQRDECAKIVRNAAISIGVGIVGEETIDEINILQAALLAMKQAVEALVPKPDFVLIDGTQLIDSPIPQKAIVKGDASSVSCAAASIIAKTTRDAIMRDYHALFPLYGFNRNKGYGTAAHLHTISMFGQTAIHRKSFKQKLAAKHQQSLGLERI